MMSLVLYEDADDELTVRRSDKNIRSAMLMIFVEGLYEDLL